MRYFPARYRKKRVAIGRPVIVVAVLIVLVTASSLYVSGVISPPARTSTASTDVSTTTSSTNQTAIQDTTLSISTRSTSRTSSTNSSQLTATCSQDALSGSYNVTAGTTDPGTICVRIYYYNSTAPLVLNLTSLLTIYETTTRDNVTYSGFATSNFTVMSDQSLLAMGGPDDENEGALVTYHVTADGDASGRFPFSLPGYLLSPQQPEECNAYGLIIAGDGQPDYDFPFDSCAPFASATDGTTSGTTSSADYITVPGVVYPLMGGYIYFQLDATVS
jgi:hypothetical protein